MRSDKINPVTGVPILPDVSNYKGSASDPFAFARRLKSPIWIFDIDVKCILYANASACDMWQAKDEDDLRKRDLATDMSPTVASRLKQYKTDFIERDVKFEEIWTLYPNGEPVSATVVYSGLYLPDGRIAMLCEAIGAAVDEPNSLRSAEALLHTDVMISLHKIDGAPLYMNPAARNAAAKTLQSLSEKIVNADDYKRMHEELERTGQHRIVTKVLTSAGLRWHDLSVKKCSDAVTGEPVMLETAIDVSELKIARDKARYLADRDQLTGCYNRTFLAQYVASLDRFSGTQCAILSLDVDRFKQINDRFGHEMGDVVLQKIVESARSAIRKDDIIIRLGGDEFVIVLEDISTEGELTKRVERLHETITKPLVHETTKLNVTVSIGVTTFSSGLADFTAIMREADIALYASKQAGRNCVTVFNEEMGAAEKNRASIEIALKKSIEDREFVLHFQPRTDLKSGKVVSAEALVRWDHPQRGLVMPGEFIPICEETGMIEDLGQLVTELGCQQAVDWQASGMDIDLSLNISPRQFSDKRLLQSLREFSQSPNFPRNRVELELTENVLIGDLDEIEKKLTIISEMGYRIAIDDFGTGYSNLSYISKFPLDCLKIDQSFVSQLPKSGPIISVILTLAKEIGATVVAEGIETQEQLDWLTEHNCDQGQGYFLSRPVPIEKFLQVAKDLNALAPHPKRPTAPCVTPFINTSGRSAKEKGPPRRAAL